MQPGTPPQDTGWPDAAETDPAALNSAEDLDEDRLRVDPLEQGIEPPERWSGADRFGTTPREQSEGPSLDQRLAEEEPDIGDRRNGADGAGSAGSADYETAYDAARAGYETTPEPADDETGYEPAADETDYQPEPDVELRGVETEYADVAEQTASIGDDAIRRGQAADEAGGSVAEAMRTPDEPQ